MIGCGLQIGRCGMIKVIAKGADGRDLLILGLAFGNLDRFRAEPRSTHIKISGKEMGLPIDVMIFSAESDAALGAFMAEFIGPDTKVHIDKSLKN
jgi:hypothetical protein